jgi:hypothetical protein
MPPKTTEVRQLVFRDVPGKDRGWFVPQPTSDQLIRREFGNGNVEIFQTPDAATADDLVEPNACLALDLGIAIGLVRESFEREPLSESDAATTQPTPVPDAERPRSSSIRKSMPLSAQQMNLAELAPK